MCENAKDNNLEKRLWDHWDEYNDELKHHYIRGDISLEDYIRVNLGENPKWDWRSVEALAKEAGTNIKPVELALDKLINAGVIVQHRNNERMFGLFERVEKRYAGNFIHPLDINVGQVIDPATFMPIAKPVVTQSNMFTSMQDCLREAQKLISQAEELNKQVLSFS